MLVRESHSHIISPLVQVYTCLEQKCLQITFEIIDSRSLGSIKSLEHNKKANTYVLWKNNLIKKNTLIISLFYQVV